MIVDDRFELLALHRALFEAKFVSDPRDQDVAGSKFVANIANRVIDELAEHDPTWHEWRQATRHPERVDVVRQRIRAFADDSRWKGWSSDERKEYVGILLSPLVGDAALLTELSSL